MGRSGAPWTVAGIAALRVAAGLAAGLLAPGLTLPVAGQAGPATAQDKPAEPRKGAPQVFPADTQVVVLDVVARDKKGRVIRDLRPEEIEVYEEGSKKEITSVRFVETGTVPAVPGARLPRPEEIAHPNLITLVFDQLGAESRLIARKASLELLAMEGRPDLVISVFQVGYHMTMLQQFTTDRAALRGAVEKATSTAEADRRLPTEDMNRAAEESRAANSNLDSMTTGASGGAASAASAGGALASAGREAAMADMAINALKLSESLFREQQGNASLYGLFALAKQQQKLAGRKTIVLFSEGLQVPPSLEQMLRSTISEANRANVSIYSVDARGLGASSDYERSRGALQEAVDASRRQLQSRGTRAVTREEAMAGETTEASLRLNLQGSLADLAQSTGGKLIANTNDAGAGLERAVADMSGYYEVIYDPRLAAFDGRFRRLEIKVNRPGVQVQTRSGYFALPPGEGTVYFPWELPLYNALKSNPPPQDFDFKAVTYRFGHEGGEQRQTLVAEVPLETVLFKREGGTARAHFSLMAVVRNAGGSVVERFSQDSPVEVPKDKEAAVKRGNAIFTRSFKLAPGRYTLEVAAMDHGTNKTSVKRSVVMVPPEPTALGLSSLALVKRTEPLPAGTLDSEDPLRVGQTRIVPFVGEPHLMPEETLSLYLVAFPKGKSTERPSLTLEFARDGRVVGRSNTDLPDADDRGRIAYIANVPCQRLSPGRYEVTAMVRQGEAWAEQRAFFFVGR
jgi:VWFA-related protein